MLAIVAAVLFVIALIIHAAGIATDRVFSATSFALAGLACLALHQAGYGTRWRGRRR